MLQLLHVQLINVFAQVNVDRKKAEIIFYLTEGRSVLCVAVTQAIEVLASDNNAGHNNLIFC